MNQSEVDSWVSENGESDASLLFAEKLPNMRTKLNRLDKRIRDVLKEVQVVFPDAQFYTAGGGFNLLLGDSHDGPRCAAQPQRSVWGGQAVIGDGDW